MNEFGFCNLTCVPVRADSSEKSEMVNQLLFGETFEIVDAIKSWKVIRGTLDKYEGFVDEKQFLRISGEEYEKLRKGLMRKTAFGHSQVTDSTGNKIIIMPASSLDGFDDGKLTLGNTTFSIADDIQSIPGTPERAGIVEAAKAFLHAPYLWGGRTLAGIDCSGLVQNAFKMNGIAVNRDASYQARQGDTLNMISEAQPGDLAFFDNEEGEIIHVGIIAGDGKIIHASGYVRIDDIDHHGIFNTQLKKYTHNLRLIKSII